MDYLEFVARVTSHILDKVKSWYYALCANAHLGKVRKAGPAPLALPMVEDTLRRIRSKGWPEMIRRVYEVNPIVFIIFFCLWRRGPVISGSPWPSGPVAVFTDLSSRSQAVLDIF